MVIIPDFVFLTLIITVGLVTDTLQPRVTSEVSGTDTALNTAESTETTDSPHTAGVAALTFLTDIRCLAVIIRAAGT